MRPQVEAQVALRPARGDGKARPCQQLLRFSAARRAPRIAWATGRPRPAIASEAGVAHRPPGVGVQQRAILGGSKNLGPLVMPVNS